MPTVSIPIGPPFAMVQNVVYALPAVKVLLFCDVAAATFEQSGVVAFSPAVALAPDSNEQIEAAGGFIRSTAGAATILLKRA